PRPGLRMLSAMSPTIVTNDGEPVMTVGSPSSNRIITTNLQIIIGQLDLGMTLPEAISEPRLSQRNLSHASTQYEDIYLDKYGSLLSELEEMGHTFTADTAVQGISAATGLEFLDDGNVRAAAEPERRGGGSAMAIDTDEIEDPPSEESSVELMLELVEDFEASGDIENEETARLLRTHLTSIDHYEQEEKMDKAIKHMESFKVMMDHQEENDLITEQAADELKMHADYLLEQWQ